MVLLLTPYTLDTEAANMSVNMTEDTENSEDTRLNEEDETMYLQTDEEYDEIFASAQMSVLDEYDIQTKARLVGPSGAGKTTLARSLAFDIKIADILINKFGLKLWDKTMDEMAVFHHMVMNDDASNTCTLESEHDTKVMCPECDGGSVYERQTKTPTYRCQSCGHEFDTSENSNSTREIPDYYSAFQEIDDIDAELKERDLIDNTGNKTEAYPHSKPEAYRDIYKEYTDGEPFPSTPYYEVGMSHAKYAKDLIGHPHIGDNGTTFIKGKITKAVEASNTEPVVLTLDEINRAPTSAKDELYDAIDGRVKVSMDEVGGVEITGDASNLIIVSTMNKGSGHHVEPLDFAEKRRLGDTYYVGYLGVEYPEKEIELVMDNTPVSEDLASEMVRTANEIRSTASNDGAKLSYGVPTGSLLTWGNKAFTNNLAGKSEPVIRAGKSAVANAIFDHHEDEISKVNTIISKNMQGVDFFIDESNESNTNSNNSSNNTINEVRYICEDNEGQNCSWSAPESKAPQDAIEYLTCPECRSIVSERKPGSN